VLILCFIDVLEATALQPCDEGEKISQDDLQKNQAPPEFGKLGCPLHSGYNKLLETFSS
jgi:hypothetical protein